MRFSETDSLDPSLSRLLERGPENRYQTAYRDYQLDDDITHWLIERVWEFIIQFVHALLFSWLDEFIIQFALMKPIVAISNTKQVSIATTSET